MGIQQRGGFPVSREFSVTTTGEINGAPVGQTDKRYSLPATTVWIRFDAVTAPVRVFFSEDDFDADIGYMEVGVGDPIEGPFQVRELWAKGSGGAGTLKLLLFSKG